MGNKYVALLLVVCLVIAGAVEAHNKNPTEETGIEACYERCLKYQCLLPEWICKFTCWGQCKGYVSSKDKPGQEGSRKVYDLAGKNLYPLPAKSKDNNGKKALN